LIDLRNTLVFTVGFIIGCLVIGLGLAILLDQKLKARQFSAVSSYCHVISFIASVWSGVG